MSIVIVNEAKFHYAYYRQFGYSFEQAVQLHNALQRLAATAKLRQQGLV